MSEEMSTELKAKLGVIKLVLKGIVEYPDLLKELEGELIPYNVIKKINRVMDLYPIMLVEASRYAVEECEEMGY